MSVAAVDEYVCPRCGVAASGASACTSCSADLDGFERLPLRSEFAAGSAGEVARLRPGRRPAKRVRVRPSPRALVLTAGVIPLLLLFQPWFEVSDEGGFLRWPIGHEADLTGWEAFSWEDLALAGTSVAIVGLAAFENQLKAGLVLRVGLGAVGAALATVMVTDFPATSRPDGYFDYWSDYAQYVSTGAGWPPVAAFMIVSAVSWWHARRLGMPNL